MKILFLAPRLPFPTDTGAKIRTYNIIKQIAKKHEVHLVCFSFDEKDEQYTRVWGLDNVHVDLVPVKEPSFLQKVFTVLFHVQPFSIAKYYSKEFEQKLIEIKAQEKYDLVHIDHLHMAHYQILFTNFPCVLDEHNVEFRILERCAKVEESFIKKTLYEQQAQKMKAFERRAVKFFATTTCVSADDKKLLDDVTTEKCMVDIIPNGVDTEFFATNKEGESLHLEEALVFTGSMDWLPNDDAVVYFAQEILPLIWQKNKNVTFYVVGRNPSKRIQDIASNEPRIIVTGRVDDVREYIHRSKIFIVPIRIGGGTRLKILEAMSMEIPVVSTSVGAEGIKYTNGSDIMIADDPQIFAEAVLLLLEDGMKCQAIGRKGRELVCNTYDWSILGKRLLGIYEQLTQTR